MTLLRPGVIALLSLAACEREARRFDPPPAATPEPRSRFMAEVAVLVSGGFTLVILALWLPTFWLHPCQ